jgi:hypothetical protein
MDTGQHTCRTWRAAGGWDLGVGRIARYVDQRRVPTSIAEAIGDQVVHALLAHVGKVIGGPGGRFSFGDMAVSIGLTLGVK